ncbi:NADH-quinone oxidoreductase subunit N [Methylomicrobium sp. Wu6]|uniref:NADH-quinone oxidoreductase subunit N n=1 Tax=Methylomicrobium sp. Wu6 TaxID=3107928 RepID=UPI002DD61DFB|nr:NADH-quinone oxidoreductase subunit N [Methylomicrobium sp. Wu6]MEC4748468.1 NADH-quinone oxidoreductase subunit N [Methylomicrobium sp. Wu6]
MNIDQLIAFLPFIAIAGTSIAVMLAIVIRRHFALASIVAVIGIVVSLIAVTITWGRFPVQVTPLMRADTYGLFFMSLLLTAGLVVIAFCYDYFKDCDGENEELLLLILIALLGGSVLTASTHFASFFIGLEILSVSLFVLIGYSFDRTKSLEAAIKYLVLSGVSSAFLLMGMALIYAQCGALDFNGIGQFIANQQTLDAMVLCGIVFIVVGLGFKLSLAPFHMWTPDVYEGAPAPVTAFVATVSKGAVFTLLLRYFISSGGFFYPSLITVFSFIAVITILAGNLLALLQQNVKRLLAYSSIAHMGYLLIAFIAGGSIAPALVTESVTFYLIAYIITTLGAFGVVSILATSKAEAAELSFYRGLFWQEPWLAAAFTVMLLSLAGIPLTAGFIGKFYMFTAGIEGGLWGLLFTLIIGSALGFYSYLRIIVVMTMNMESPVNADDKLPYKWISYAALGALTVLVFWLGIYPGDLMELIQS